ncbi:hypothetical protein EVG20_g11689 [Dentipellis fragilis]|uniref:Uncharacterized protein n=1 Tax=Dentipellis fragilis TaxID=205917 RepID=A0A4Y9XKF3_9AGAM|nr:hypothetical protein EVG20_g11689 [Dentipellis fragilis]
MEDMHISCQFTACRLRHRAVRVLPQLHGPCTLAITCTPSSSRFRVPLALCLHVRHPHSSARTPALTLTSPLPVGPRVASRHPLAIIPPLSLSLPSCRPSTRHRSSAMTRVLDGSCGAGICPETDFRRWAHPDICEQLLGSLTFASPKRDLSRRVHKCLGGGGRSGTANGKARKSARMVCVLVGCIVRAFEFLTEGRRWHRQASANWTSAREQKNVPGNRAGLLPSILRRVGIPYDFHFAAKPFLHVGDGKDCAAEVSVRDGICIQTVVLTLTTCIPPCLGIFVGKNEAGAKDGYMRAGAGERVSEPRASSKREKRTGSLRWTPPRGLRAIVPRNHP